MYNYILFQPPLRSFDFCAFWNTLLYRGIFIYNNSSIHIFHWCLSNMTVKACAWICSLWLENRNSSSGAQVIATSQIYREMYPQMYLQMYRQMSSQTAIAGVKTSERSPQQSASGDEVTRANQKYYRSKIIQNNLEMRSKEPINCQLKLPFTRFQWSLWDWRSSLWNDSVLIYQLKAKRKKPNNIG